MNSLVTQSLVDALPFPALILSKDLVVECGNSEAEILLETAVKGQPFGNVLRHKKALKCVNEAVKTGQRTIKEFNILVPTPRLYQASAALVGDLDEGRLLFTLVDVSAELDAEKSRSTFVANVSHELRSPLTSLSGIVETLKGPARNDLKAQDKFLDIMQGETERMSRLVGDLLSLSKLEAKEHVAPKDDVDIVLVVQRVMDVLMATSPDNAGRVKLTSPAGPMMVTGNRDELTEVFQNLIENALKYSGLETDVAVVISQTSDDLHPIKVTVQDYGDGISAEHLPHLTERFYRVDKGRSREMGGTGLGLAITKHILSRHRAKWNFQSELGQGTLVTIALRALG